MVPAKLVLLCALTLAPSLATANPACDEAALAHHTSENDKLISMLKDLKLPNIDRLLPGLDAEFRLKTDVLRCQERSQTEIARDAEAREQALAIGARNRAGRGETDFPSPPSSLRSSVAGETIPTPPRSTGDGGIFFSCRMSGTRNGDFLEFTVENCSARPRQHNDVKVMAVNGRIFKEFTPRLQGKEAQIIALFTRTLESHIVRNRLNPSGERAAAIQGMSLQISEMPKEESAEKDKRKQSSTQVTAVLEGSLEHFEGEVLPITKTDQLAFGHMFNFGAYNNAKKAILSDFAQLAAEDKGNRFSKLFEFGGLGMSLLREDADRTWVISLGAGFGSKGMFELLQKYYQANPQGKVIYRTTSTRTKWTTSRFPNQWSHQIDVSQIQLPVEYYAIPGSVLIVYRLNPDNADPRDPGNYGVITPAPFPYRSSFSTHLARSKDVTSNWGVDKRFSADLYEVIRAMTGANGGSFGEFAISMQPNWTSHSDLFGITARKLYLDSSGPVPFK